MLHRSFYECSDVPASSVGEVDLSEKLLQVEAEGLPGSRRTLTEFMLNNLACSAAFMMISDFSELEVIERMFGRSSLSQLPKCLLLSTPSHRRPPSPSSLFRSACLRSLLEKSSSRCVILNLVRTPYVSPR